MTIFWALAGIMIMVALLFTLPGLLRSYRQQDTDVDTVNIEVVKAQLAELKSDLGNSRIDESQYLAAREDLERELLVYLSDTPAESDEVKVRSGRWAVLVLVVLIPGLTTGLYQVVGTQEIIPLLVKGDAAESGESVISLGDLTERVRQGSDNVEAWVLLARSYTKQQRFDDAAVVYAKVHRLIGDHADLLVEYADTLVMANGGEFTSQAGALLLEALETEPDNLMALWLSGHWENQRENYADAVRYWQQAVGQMSPDSEDARVTASLIRQARDHLVTGELVGESAVRAEATGVTAAVASRAITVSVTLDPLIAAGTAADDTVFIFARAVSGPRMPLAIVRKQVSDLPVTVTLDDSMAMLPDMKLSNFDEVVVGARISRSGMAMPQSGDLQGLVTPVIPGFEQNIKLNINSRIP